MIILDSGYDPFNRKESFYSDLIVLQLVARRLNEY